MTYYDTIEEDLQRAKKILASGRELPAECNCSGGDQGDGLVALPHESGCALLHATAVGICGGDNYAAYKLLESFVAEIERLTTLLHHEGIEHSESQEALIAAQAKLTKQDAEIERLRVAYATLHDSVKDIYAEGLDVGMDLGKKLDR